MPSPELDQLQAALSSAYRIERELGRGGMAVVYLAHDLKHERHVALKVLLPNTAAALGAERFRREITTAAKLQHPHILSVYDSGELSSGQLWFTMPFVEGESLRDRIQREGQLPVDEAVRITREIAGALDHAHQQGIVHRDIKPENILLTKGGDALVADFGIARALTAAGDPPSGTFSITQTGVVVGTPQYMSPEQASGERRIDGRSDLYTLATVLYEMLTGEPPFTGPNPRAIVAKMLSTTAPAVTVTRPDVPAPIDAVIRRALSRAPADRWATTGEFSRALVTAERTTAAMPIATAPARRLPRTAIAMGLSFAVGAGLLFAWRSRGSVAPDAGPLRLAVLPFANLGDSADAYFADGMTEAVRSKLTGVPGIEIIGSASSGQYRNTTKSPKQIGEELGVRYILVGNVRWSKGADGASRVRVNPELVDASSSADKWASPFDAPLTDVFQVQGDIAGKVAQALQLALTPAAQQTMAQRPTNDLVAYDAYLRGMAATTSSSPVVLHQAIASLREAVTRDSNFAAAWAEMGGDYALVWSNGVPLPAYKDSADQATARALRLAPNSSEAHLNRSTYYDFVTLDKARALAEAEAGLAVGVTAPLLRRAASAEEGLGRWDAAAAHAAQAAALDPRDDAAMARVADVAWHRRRSADAVAAAQRAFTLDPHNLGNTQRRIAAALQTGDLAAARRAIADAVPASDPDAVVAVIAGYQPYLWLLDHDLVARIPHIPPSAMDNDIAAWGLMQAEFYLAQGDRPRTFAYADSARIALETTLRLDPESAYTHAQLGLALAFLGRTADAIREGRRAVALDPTSADEWLGPVQERFLARIYVLVGQPERALDLLEPQLKTMTGVTGAWLRVDPTWSALRSNPRFQKMIAAPVTPP